MAKFNSTELNVGSDTRSLLFVDIQKRNYFFCTHRHSEFIICFMPLKRISMPFKLMSDESSIHKHRNFGPDSAFYILYCLIDRLMWSVDYG